MACEGCHSEIKAKRAKEEQIVIKAQSVANESRQWVGIGIDGVIYVGADTVGKTIQQWVTPNSKNSLVHVH